MHKKSIEAAEKMKEEDDDDENIDIELSDKVEDKSSQSSPPVPAPNKENLRTESIASLRAKAMTYTAQIKENLSDAIAPTGLPMDNDNEKPPHAHCTPLTAATKLRHENEKYKNCVTSSRDTPNYHHDDRWFSTPNYIDVVDPGDNEILDPVK